jgi:hypothetical protein
MMKRFILERKMTYTERAEVEAESWDAAKVMLESDDVEFETIHDDIMTDSSIEFVGDD